MASPSWLKFNLLETVGLDNKIGHLFVVDIQFDECEYMYNEIMPSITEKQTKRKVENESCLVYQLLQLPQKMSDDVPKMYWCTKKSYVTLSQKKFIQLYLESKFESFLIKRCSRRVTKIYTHYTFKQARFKRDFVLKNQKSRRNAKNSIKKDF